MASTPTPSTPASTRPAHHTGCGCGCQEPPPRDGCCCELVCFERPHYFCGHLLTDADLTAEQTYVREKNRLYHRALDGSGVACGLRLTCEPNCDGFIRVGEGFAIDDCGNDLVLCKPRRFDVMGELRKKGWVTDPPCDPCHPEKKEPDCDGKRCFWVVACYAEEKTDYTTPFQSGCSPGPSACEPTRIREDVRFELRDELPHRPGPLDEIERRIERCFKVFREGQFARGLKELAPQLLKVLEGGGQAGAEAHELFAKLRALFLHHLRVSPDPHHCQLEREVWRVCCPEPRDPAARREETCEAAIQALLELVERYVFGCVLAELAVPCPAPCEPCCVLIGSVEVEHGCLVRVIDYPRWYLWSWANLVEVLVFTLASEAYCPPRPRLEPRPPAEGREPEGAQGVREPRQREEERERREGCCPEPEVDPRFFLRVFLAEPRAKEYAARASVQALRAMGEALRTGFDFTGPHALSPRMFEGMPAAQASELAKALEIPFTLSPGAAPPGMDPVSAVLANLLQHRGEGLVAYGAAGADRLEAKADRGPVVAYAGRADVPAAAVVEELSQRIARLEKDLETLRTQRSGGGGGKSK